MGKPMLVHVLSHAYLYPNIEERKPAVCKRAMMNLATCIKQIASFLIHWISLPFVLVASFLKAKKWQILPSFFSNQERSDVKKVRFNEKVDVRFFERVSYASEEYPDGYWSGRTRASILKSFKQGPPFVS